MVSDRKQVAAVCRQCGARFKLKPEDRERWLRCLCPVCMPPPVKTPPQPMKKRRARKRRTREWYKAYRKTPHWKAKRAQALKELGRVCYGCGSKEHLVVHHLNYDHLYGERMSDLRILCKACHEAEHAATIAEAAKTSS